MQASLLGVSLEAYAADNDMLGSILRSVRGLEVDQQTLSLDTIRQVCHGEGHYLGHIDTLNRMKSDYYYPQLGDRQTPDDWRDSGGTDMHTRARDWTRQITAEYFPQYIDAKLDAQWRSEYPIVLAPDAMSSPA